MDGIKKIRHIYYRGHLKSCNYHCEYCPFSKRKATERELKKDKEILKQFIDNIFSGQIVPTSVLFTPYGEALIHSYYWEEMARLTSLEHMWAVGAQTNLSFSIEKMLELFEKAGGNILKLRLWCTYHPSMTGMDKFLEQCERLDKKGIKFCIGTVGVPENIELITELRRKLPQKIYFWINRMDNLKRTYTEEEKRVFMKIDPYFSLELQEPKAEKTYCMGGEESVLIDEKGNLYPCHICRNKIGNLYEENRKTEKIKKEKIDIEEQDMNRNSICNNRKCNCFLAYANRTDIEKLKLFDVHPSFRIPILDDWKDEKYKKIKAIFWDIDGTLVKKNGQIEEATKRLIEALAKNYELYFATSLPYRLAMKKCAQLKVYFEGGTFADGAYQKLFKEKKAEILLIEAEEMADMWNELERIAKKWNLNIKIYEHNGHIYKITVLPHKREKNSQKEQQIWIEQEIEKLIQGRGKLIKEDGMIGIVNKRAGKAAGIRSIGEKRGIKREEIAVVGNSENDIEMLEYYACSIAAGGAQEEVKKRAEYHLF